MCTAMRKSIAAATRSHVRDLWEAPHVVLVPPVGQLAVLHEHVVVTLDSSKESHLLVSKAEARDASRNCSAGRATVEQAKKTGDLT